MTMNDPSALARRLIAAANELLATAYELGSRPAHPDKPGAPASLTPERSPSQPTDDEPQWLLKARQTYRDRRRRDAIFGDADLFGEPAWDILLDLFIAAREGKRISITSACIGAAAPSTTALRWLNVLEREGLIERQGDARDMRRSYVRLTATAYGRMVDYFAEASVPGEQLDPQRPDAGNRSSATSERSGDGNRTVRFASGRR
jgi:hypothetical protein